jgi:hypothetical protein
MQRTTHSLKRYSPAQVLVWLLLLGFMWLQFLGTEHRYWHPEGSGTAIVQAKTPAWLPDHSHDQPSDSSHKPQACQLFDLACADSPINAAFSSLVSVDVQTLPLHFGVIHQLIFVFWAFDARGPPTLI